MKMATNGAAHAASSAASDAMPPKTIGSTWLTYFEEQWWPIVLCDVATTPKALVDGLPEGQQTGVLLGVHKFIRVLTKHLAPYNPLAQYVKGRLSDVQLDDDHQTRRLKERLKAFEQDAKENKDHEYWSNYTNLKYAARGMDHDRRRLSSSPLRRKRRRSDADNEFPVKRRASRETLFVGSPSHLPLRQKATAKFQQNGDEDIYHITSSDEESDEERDEEEPARESDEEESDEEFDLAKIQRENSRLVSASEIER